MMKCTGPRTRAFVLGIPLAAALLLSGLNIALAAQADGPPPAGWQTFHSDQGGFTIAIPAGWTIQESTLADGTLRSDFLGDGAGLGVTVGPSSDMAVDLPNTRCETVAIGGTTGTLCFDTLAGSTIVSVDAAGRTFRLSSGRRLDPAILQQIVGSFVPDGTSAAATTAAPVQSAAPDSAPPALGDTCMFGGGPSKARILCAVP